MFPKQFRLRGKDILFLTRRKQYFCNGFFGFFWFNQYPNLKYHQISVHIGLKYSKRATERVKIKRMLLEYLHQQEVIKKPIQGKYYKIFIMLHKKNIEEFTKKIANMEKKAIIKCVEQEFEKSFTRFQSFVGKS